MRVDTEYRLIHSIFLKQFNWLDKLKYIKNNYKSRINTNISNKYGPATMKQVERLAIVLYYYLHTKKICERAEKRSYFCCFSAARALQKKIDIYDFEECNWSQPS